MICARHHAIATHAENGQPFCMRCFGEARRAANAVALEGVIRRVRERMSAADWLEQHYGYRRPR